MAFIYRPLANTFYAVSVWITVTMAWERYSLLKKLNSFVTKLNTKSINWVVTFFYVAMFIVHIPFYFYVKIENGAVISADVSLTLGYKIWSLFRALIAKYIPIVLIVAINGAIMAELWRARKRRKIFMARSHNTVARKQNYMKSVSLLFAISITFLLCNILEPIPHLHDYGPCKFESYFYQAGHVVIDILEVSGASANFIFYVALNRRFREVCLLKLRRSKILPRSVTDDNSRDKNKVINTIGTRM